MEVLGILNLTRDSFSDGGMYLEPERAIAHARQMLADGAAIIDVGAQSTRPEAEEVTASEELARLTPVIRELRDAGARISVDTFRPAVLRAVLPLGVELINDVTALRDPECVAIVREWLEHEERGGTAGSRPAPLRPLRVILMHSTAARGARAERTQVPAGTIVERVVSFFDERIETLEAAGIPRSRLILDPGMGLFLGTDPAASLVVLRNVRRLAAFGLPLCISPTRKSFLGHVLAREGHVRPIVERSAGTLASELWAAVQGVQYIRTHDVRALRDAWTVWQAIANAPGQG